MTPCKFVYIHQLLVFSVMEAVPSETSVLIQQYTRFHPRTQVITLQAHVHSELDWLTFKIGPLTELVYCMTVSITNLLTFKGDFSFGKSQK